MQARIGGARREGVSLVAVGGAQDSCSPSRWRRGHARRAPAWVSGGRSRRSAASLIASWRSRRVVEAAEDLAHANERLLPVGGAVEIEPDAVHEIGSAEAEVALAIGREIGRVLTWRQRHDLDHESLLGRQLLMPRSVAASPPASPSKQSQRFREIRELPMPFVSAVPIAATTGSSPPATSAITSCCPRPRSPGPLGDRRRARSSPYRTSPLWKRSLSGEFTYLPGSGSSRAACGPGTRDAAARVGEREHQACGK